MDMGREGVYNRGKESKGEGPMMPPIKDRLIILEETDSTNTYLKNLPDAAEGQAVLARRQSGGRGRQGRSFSSPEGGLYMSILLIGREVVDNVDSITVRTAVAVKNAIKELTGLESVGIKWVNDIYCEDKKICGILAERVVRKGFCDFTTLYV